MHIVTFCPLAVVTIMPCDRKKQCHVMLLKCVTGKGGGQSEILESIGKSKPSSGAADNQSNNFYFHALLDKVNFGRASLRLDLILFIFIQF